MKIGDIEIELPEGHVIVTSGEHGWEPMWPIDEINFSGRRPMPLEILLHPDAFRIVPRAMIDEYRAIRDRHDEEYRQFHERLQAMRTIHVDVSIR